MMQSLRICSCPHQNVSTYLLSLFEAQFWSARERRVCFVDRQLDRDLGQEAWRLASLELTLVDFRLI